MLYLFLKTSIGSDTCLTGWAFDFKLDLDFGRSWPHCTTNPLWMYTKTLFSFANPCRM